MEKVKLTKEEFIKRAMNGEVFELNGDKYFYDVNKTGPFRFNDSPLKEAWETIDGKNEFTVVEPETEIESWAEFLVYKSDTDRWLKTMHRSLDECKKYWESKNYSHHHEIEGTRIELPKVKKEK